MRADIYLKAVLTVIAIELAWLGARETAVPVTAQGATPVIITGVQLSSQGTPIRVDVGQPVKVEADRPLPVNQIPYTPGLRPGE